MAHNFDSEHEADGDLDLPLPGFRFHPTDEELVGRKIEKRPLSIDIIKHVDIYKHHPWDFQTCGEKEWYFFCQRGRKYRNSARPNRVTGSGFWKATGTDKPIYSSYGMHCIGLKKSLVYYRGRAANALKTDWMMHEFRLPSYPLPNDSWTICRIFKRTNSVTHGVTSASTSGHLHQTEPQNFNSRTSSYCVCGFSGRLASGSMDQIGDSGGASQIPNGITENVELDGGFQGKNQWGEGRSIGFPVGSFDLTKFLVEMSDHDAGDCSFNQFSA